MPGHDPITLALFAGVALLLLVTIAAVLWFAFEFRWDRRLFSASPPHVAKNLSADEAETLIHSTTDLVILDVRPHDKFRIGHLPNAIRLPVTDPHVETKLNELDKSAPHLVYCDGGYRSRKAFGLMKKLGFHNIYNLNRGILSWRLNGHPAVK